MYLLWSGSCSLRRDYDDGEDDWTPTSWYCRSGRVLRVETPRLGVTERG